MHRPFFIAMLVAIAVLTGCASQETRESHICSDPPSVYESLLLLWLLL